MLPTTRQKEILNTVIKEYVSSAIPISSHLLNEKYSFDVSPATLRIEMQKLTDQGFLQQPHTSAGRIPTDLGYRFFVNELLEKGSSNLSAKKRTRISKEVKKEIKDNLRFIQVVTRVLASSSSNLGLSYIFNKNVLWKEGWGDILNEPEFQDSDFTARFTKAIKCFEKDIDKFAIEPSSEIHVYIGSENPSFKNKDISVITAKFNCPDLNCQGIFAILGPKRMNYNKNISIVNLLTELLEE